MLQTRTVEPKTLGLLKSLMAMPIIAPFYLVGGTALALQLGHRKSIDLDLFTTESFDKTTLLATLDQDFDLSITAETDSMLITYLNEVKVDFVKMAYPILTPTIVSEGVRMLSIQDIAPMKLKAIVQRGSKKDFYDIYFLLDLMSLQEIIGLFQSKFKQREIFHVIKSLTYFEDAEAYANPLVFDKTVTWEIVKSKIVSRVQALVG